MNDEKKIAQAILDAQKMREKSYICSDEGLFQMVNINWILKNAL